MDNGSSRKNRVEFFFNSKGGVGKSHHAALLVQAYRHAGLPVIAIDADATSASFSSFSALDVMRIELMAGDAINPRRFDDLYELVITKDLNFVIDTGASAFVETNKYFIKNAIPEHIEAAGKTLVANIILTGDATFNETSMNLEAMAAQMPPSVDIVVWLNEHFGPIAREGKSFQEMEIHARWKHRIAAIVKLPDWTHTEKDTFGVDVRKMMTAGLTFAQVRASPEFTLMAKSRLHELERQVYAQLTPIIAAG